MVAAYVDPRDEEIKRLKNLVASGYLVVDVMRMIATDSASKPINPIIKAMAKAATSDFMDRAKVYVPQHMIDFIEAADKKDNGDK